MGRPVVSPQGRCRFVEELSVFDLTGKVAVVTGGGRGIGCGIVRMLVKAGASVAIAGRGVPPLEDTAAEMRSHGGRVITVPTDITDADAIALLLRRTVDELGPIDCWVNNAGSANPNDVGKLITLTESQWDAVVDLNLKWTFFCAQAAARHMIERGAGGSIINISSRSRSQPNPNTGQYGASKAGLENLTTTMAVEWGHHGIRVNAVAPGVVEVDDGDKVTLSRESRRRRQIETVPLRRLGTVDDIGAVCVFLASDEAAWITGDTIQVTGGSRIPVGYLTFMHHITEQLAAKSEETNTP
jgi:3-oxoacyl-[acyl-carrier protein] reductase